MKYEVTTSAGLEWVGHNPAMLLAAGALIAVAYVLFTYRNRAVFSSASSNVLAAVKGKENAGPPGRPLRGNLNDLNARGKASCTRWWALYQQYGPVYELTIPFYRIHVINHPSYLEYIQKTNARNFVRGAFTRNALGQLHRTGIFVSDGDAWTFQRKTATRAFSKKNFESHITRVLHRHLDLLVGLLRRLAERKQPFDFQDIAGRMMFTLFLGVAFHTEVGTEKIFSDDPDCLKGNAPFVEAFDQAQGLFDRRRRDPLWKVTEYVTGQNKVTARALSLFYDYIDGIIQERLDRPQSDKVDPDAGVDLLELFMQSTRDKHELGGMCFSFLVAGRDTTAYATSWLLYELFHHKNNHLNPVEKVRAEIEREGLSSSFLLYGEANKLKFLNAMWDESARLNTVSPAGQLEVAEDDVLPAVPELGMPARPIKKGDVVGYHNYVMARMPEIWGEDCAQFKPERWFNEKGDYINPSPFKYHAWNAGPRTCLGRALATHEGLSIATAILNNFDVVLQEPDKLAESLPAMNMGIDKGLWMTVSERKS